MLGPGRLSYLSNFPIDVLKIDRSFFGVFRLPVVCLEVDTHAKRICGTFLKILKLFENCAQELLRKIGAGDGDRTRNIQLGNLNFRSFIFIVQKKCTCMPCIPCMMCLICVSLRDVGGPFLSCVVTRVETYLVRSSLVIINVPKATLFFESHRAQGNCPCRASRTATGFS